MKSLNIHKTVWPVLLCSLLAACSGDISAPVTTSGSPSVPTSYTLNVANSGGGIVTSLPVGINCGSSCSASFDPGISVTLTAVANSGYTFTGWSGACTGTGTCANTMSAARSVTAAFTQNPAPVGPGAPAITLSATPALVVYNATAVITWSSTNSSSC
jgi:uncharacterized repeat protein (TIGR02543 family)